MLRPLALARAAASALSLWVRHELFVCTRCGLSQIGAHREVSWSALVDERESCAPSESRPAHLRVFVAATHERLGLGAHLRVLEVGAGDGSLRQCFSHRGIPCVGIESIAGAAAIARGRGIEMVERCFGYEAAVQLRRDRGPADLVVANRLVTQARDLHDLVSGLAPSAAQRFDGFVAGPSTWRTPGALSPSAQQSASYPGLSVNRTAPPALKSRYRLFSSIPHGGLRDNAALDIPMTSHLDPSTPVAVRSRMAAAGRGGGRRGAAEAQWRDGVKALEAARWSDARRHFGRATELAPDQSLFWSNLAQAHRKLGELGAAQAAARQAIALDPADLLACKLAGISLTEQHRYADAVEVFAALAPHAPRDHDYHCEYGQALYMLGRVLESTRQFIFSFTCKPDFVPAHARLSNAFARLGMHSEAAECLRTVELLQPWDAQALGNLVHQSQNACSWQRLAEDTERLHETIEHHSPPQTTPFTYVVMDSTPRQQRLAAEISVRFEFGAIQPFPVSTRAPRPAGERLRIGYASGDFQHHATAMLMTEVLEKHDRNRFDVFLYSYGLDDGTAWRRRMMSSIEHWVDGSQMSDLELARRIRDDGIDIAVDLKGFTRASRMKIFAYRPAPIQVAWLGFPGTCGADFIDYVIGDTVVTPAEAQPDFSERIAQMPLCYQPNDRQRPLGTPVTRAQCGLPEAGFVFSCFNNSYKILPPVFDRWCNLLRAVPDSVLWLYEANPQATDNLLREAHVRGIAPQRIVFAPFLSQERHLARLPAADLFLDTFPCNAHTTASDSLWAGVPLVTCMGETFASRVAASLLRAAECDELITRSLDEYEALALALARDPMRLAGIRNRLISGRQVLALFDSSRFATDLEALFERMARRHREGLAPGSLWAEPTLLRDLPGVVT